MDQLVLTETTTSISGNKTDETIKKKATLFLNKFSLQKSINREQRSLSKQNQTQSAIIQNQNFSVLPVNLSVASGSLDNHHGNAENVINSLPATQSREQGDDQSSSTKNQNDTTFMVTTSRSTLLPLCRRRTKLYQLGQANQVQASASERTANNSSIKCSTGSSSRTQSCPSAVQRDYSSNSSPTELHAITRCDTTKVDRPYTKNEVEHLSGCRYPYAISQLKNSFSCQRDLIPVKKSIQPYSREISPPIEKDSQSPDSKYPDSTSSRSDEDETTTPPLSECNFVRWISTENAMDSRYYKSRRSTSHGDYLITAVSSDAVGNRDALSSASEPPSSALSYCPQNDNDNRIDLDRSTSALSRASSCTSTVNVSQVSLLSSKSIFGKSEFQKKESKAIAMWHATVQSRIAQRKIASPLDHNQPYKPKVNLFL